MKNDTLIVSNLLEHCFHINENNFDILLHCLIPNYQFGGFGRIFDDNSDFVLNMIID